jgi:uncharacterized membrane protein
MTEKLNVSSNGRRVALAVSIVVNFFLLAIVVGHLLRARPQTRAGLPLARALAAAEASLPPADSVRFSAVLRRDAPKYAEAEHQLVEARRELAKQMTADNFDPEKARAAFAKWRVAWNRFLDDFSGTLVDAVGEISPAGRRQLATERKGAFATP